MKTTLQRWGNSQGIRIPKNMLQILGMGVGSELLIELSENKTAITVTPAQDTRPIRGRHKIEELLASSNLDALDNEYNWGNAEGKEIW